MPTYKSKKGDNIKTIKPISRAGQKLLGMKNVRKTTKKAGGGKMTKPKSLRDSVQDYYEGQVKDVKDSFGLYLKGEPEAIAKKRTIRDNPKAIKKLKEQRKKEYASKTAADKTTGDPRGVNRKKAGGAMKKKGYSAGGKLKMVEKNGKKVPFFAADGVGKMAKGGSMKGAIKAGQKFKKPGESMEDMMIRVAKEQGVFKKKDGGSMKKGYAKGGSVKVKSGDTLSQIAKKRGVTLKALLAANPSIKNANMIRVGQSIKIPGARTIGRGGRSNNPYAGMSQTQMNQLRSKDKATQRAGTSGMRAQVKSGGSPTTPNAKKAATVKASKDGTAAAMEKARARRAAAKKAPPKKKAAPSMSGLRAGDVAAKRGGMMKKGYKYGGTVRGSGAATKGKRFGRCG